MVANIPFHENKKLISIIFLLVGYVWSSGVHSFTRKNIFLSASVWIEQKKNW